MRTLGPNTTLVEYRLDLVFLHASLLADENPAVSACADPVGIILNELRTERDLFERTEDAAEVMSARTARRDKTLDRKVVMFGGVVRSVSTQLYEICFPKLPPSGVAKSPLKEEVLAVEKLLGELARLPDTDPVRVTYEPPLRDALAGVKVAVTAEEQTDTALALAQSRLTQFKLRADRERHVTFGKLVAILGDKKSADEYFRPKPRNNKDEETPPAPPAPPAT